MLLSIFTHKKKLPIINRDSSIGILCHCFPFLISFQSAVVKNIIGWELVHFALHSCRNLARFNTVVNNSVQPYLLLTNSSFPLRLSESQEVLYLGQICQNSEARIWKQAYCHQPVHPFSGKARCFNQSERALYGNVITKNIYIRKQHLNNLL